MNFCQIQLGRLSPSQITAGGNRMREIRQLAQTSWMVKLCFFIVLTQGCSEKDHVTGTIHEEAQRLAEAIERKVNAVDGPNRCLATANLRAYPQALRGEDGKEYVASVTVRYEEPRQYFGTKIDKIAGSGEYWEKSLRLSIDVTGPEGQSGSTGWSIKCPDTHKLLFRDRRSPE